MGRHETCGDPGAVSEDTRHWAHGRHARTSAARMAVEGMGWSAGVAARVWPLSTPSPTQTSCQMDHRRCASSVLEFAGTTFQARPKAAIKVIARLKADGGCAPESNDGTWSNDIAKLKQPRVCTDRRSRLPVWFASVST